MGKIHCACNVSFFQPICKAMFRREKMPEENFETALTLLKGVLDYENFRDVDLVIEVRPEHQI